jgi:hypothetical protein
MQQEKFSLQWWLEVYVVTLLATRKSKQTALHPQLTVVVVRHQHLASLKNQNKTKLVTIVFVIFSSIATSKAT